MPQLLARAVLALLPLALLAPLTSLAAAQDEPPPPAEEPPTGELVVWVMDEDDEPLFKADVIVERTEEARDKMRREGDQFAPMIAGLTDPDGQLTIEIPAGGARTFWVMSADGTSEKYEGSIEALEPGERREIEVTLRTRNDATFRGRLVDASSGAPIAGAKIAAKPKANYMSFSVNPRALRAPSTPSTVSADDGTFEVDAATWRRTQLDVFAEGYSIRRVNVGGTVDAAGLDDPIDLPITRERVIAVQVIGPTEGLNARMTHGLSNELVEQSTANLLEGTDHVGFAPAVSSEEATFLFRQLPITGHVDIVFQRGGSTIHELRHHSLEGAPGRVEVEVDLRTDGEVTGRVVDEDGAAIANQAIWIGDAAGTVGTWFPPYTQPMQVTKTDQDGRFSFSGLVRGKYLVAYPARRGMDGPTEGPVCAGKWVDLRRSTEAPDLELVQVNGLSISGILLDPEGRPCAGHVSAHRTGEGGSWHAQQRVRSDDGRFTVGPLLPGTYSISGFGGGTLDLGPSRDVLANTGDVDVEVQLSYAGAVKGSTIKLGLGTPVAADVRCFSGTRLTSFVESSGTDGLFEFSRLAVGEHHIFARTEDGWLSARVPVEVEARVTLEDFEVELEQGGLVLLRQTGGTGFSSCEVRINDEVLYSDGLRANGVAKLSVPAGRVTLRATNRETGGEATLELDVEVGATIERTVDLSPPDSGKK